MKKSQDDKNFISPHDLESQEHLSLTRLNSLTPDYLARFGPTHSLIPQKLSPRPIGSFLELMNWAVDNFATIILADNDLNKFVHNRIIIDGQFMHYCDLEGIKISCLHKDSIISWKTDTDQEKFFAQGIFLIKGDGFEFISCALFHKGNQHEDEISFFSICPSKHYEKYITFRNNFDSWLQQRDRSNLHIKIMDGVDTPYTRDQAWSDLFLPEEIKSEIKQSVENFLVNKAFYLTNKIPWKRGILLFGEPGNGKTSIIRTIISNYNFKPVTIVAGANDDSIHDAFSYAEEQSPSLLFFEDLDSILEKTISTASFLNLMDGISAKNGLLVVATANNIDELKPSIKDRPSRFDKKWKIPLPDQKMATLFLKKWFGTIAPIEKYKELAAHAVKYKFSYAYLKELYISSMFEALANNREFPSSADISKALERLMKDKNITKSGRSVSTEKYFTK